MYQMQFHYYKSVITAPVQKHSKQAVVKTLAKEVPIAVCTV